MIVKAFTAIFTLAMLNVASAQGLLMPPSEIKLPKTGNLINNATREVIGTVTFLGNRAYLRDKDGKPLGTVVYNKDGTRTAYDDSGKVIPMPGVPVQ